MLAYEAWERSGWRLGRSGIEDTGSQYYGLDFAAGEGRLKSGSDDDTMSREVAGQEGWRWYLYDDLSGNLVDPAGDRRLTFDLPDGDSLERFLRWTSAYDARLRKAADAGLEDDIPTWGDFPGEARLPKAGRGCR